MGKIEKGYKLKVINDIVEVRVPDRMLHEDLLALKDEIIGISIDKPMDILVDMTEVKTPDESTWDISERFFDKLPFRRYAIYGGAPAINLGTKELISSLDIGENIKVFRREADARAWLAEKTK